jgi:hypothetical protein
MNNKYNLDFNEAMNTLNGFIDVLEDTLDELTDEFIGEPIKLEQELNYMKESKDLLPIIQFQAEDYLMKLDLQGFFNQVLINAAYEVFLQDVLPGTDMEPLFDYYDSISEKILIEDVTEILDDIFFFADSLE